MNLILIRHGEIDSNIRKIYSGRSSEPLNLVGRNQAELAARQLHGLQIAALLTSPLRRAVETAGIIGRQLDLNPRSSDFLNELRMGPWEGLSEAEVESRYPAEFGTWNSRPADLNLDGRETLEELRRRVTGGLLGLGEHYGGAQIAVVSHVAVIRVLILESQGRPLNDYKTVSVPNATPISIFLGNDQRDPAFREKP